MLCFLVILEVKPEIPLHLPGLPLLVGAGLRMQAVRAGLPEAEPTVIAELHSQIPEEPPAVWETGLSPGSGRFPGGGDGYTAVFLPGEFHGQRSLEATVHGVAESDMLERFSLSLLTLL